MAPAARTQYSQRYWPRQKFIEYHSIRWVHSILHTLSLILKSPGFWLFLPSYAHGDFWSGIVSAGCWSNPKLAEFLPNFPNSETGTLKSGIKRVGLNSPAYWDGIKWSFDYFNSAITIIVCKGEFIDIGLNCLTIPMVNPEACRMFHVCGLPIGVPK